jgi:hypothetical protein
MHGVDRALQLEIVQVEHGEDHDVGLERLKEPGVQHARPYAEGVPARETASRGTVGSEVMWQTVRALGEEADERLKLMPVLMGFGEVAVARRKLLEAAVVAPVLPHLHEISRMRGPAA